MFSGGVMSTIPKYWGYGLKKKKKSHIILYTPILELYPTEREMHLSKAVFRFQHFHSREQDGTSVTSNRFHTWADCMCEQTFQIRWALTVGWAAHSLDLCSTGLDFLISNCGRVQRISGSVRKTARKQDMLKNRVKASTSLMGWTTH